MRRREEQKDGDGRPAIMPAIITAHMTNVNRTSTAVQGVWVDMPISAIIVSCSMETDIWRSR